MDPLSVLKDFTTRGDLDKIERVGANYRFGSGYSFPCATETAYRSKGGSLYTLEALVHYVKNHHLKLGEYMQSTVKNSVPAVTLPDRKPLLDYLTGRNEEYRPDQDNSAFVSRENAVEEVDGYGGEDVDYIMLIRSNERPLKSRDAILECKNRDFHSVLVNSTKREEERQRIESHQRKDGLVAKSDDSGYDANPKSKLRKIGEGVPIILVPSAFQTLITIYNVKEFLEDGVYIPNDVKAKEMKGVKPDCITVQKKFSRDRERVVTAYEVRDKPSALKPDDWDRVVAVFVLGKDWQFKDWPFKDHVEIFNKIIGFFLRFEDDSIESAKTVKQWNVKIISISKNKRHQDRAAALEVWEKLEEFVRSRSHS
ncbi:BnaC05g29870D [Brassica napus]|uniref:BnaC05g29870D protein n=1 Tax=Brassica napus TaxID=3708 RepID=A0A078FB69_BRANA|nr:BnaC05g29870D [Brassica napus]